eukprot:2246970-Pleurochrysis_carterae.AAC.1
MPRLGWSCNFVRLCAFVTSRTALVWIASIVRACMCSQVSEAGEPAPPRLDFLQHKEAPLRKRGPTFQSAPSNLTNERRSLPESKSERFSGGGVDMSAL